MSMANSKKERVHNKAVERLRHVAERLKKEGVISDYNWKQFKIPSTEVIDLNYPTLRINPDLVLYVPEKGKILVEVANPRDAKRFIGEVIYPYILVHFERVAGAIVFALPPQKGSKAPKEGPERGIIQKWALHKIRPKQIPFTVIIWSEDWIYNDLKLALKWLGVLQEPT